MREGRIPPAARRIRLELTREATHVDRADARGIALLVHRTELLGSCLGVEQSRLGCVAAFYRDAQLRRVVAELREPEAMLVDEVEREAIFAWRNRPANVEVAVDALAGPRVDAVSDPVPHDRVAPLVEPVVGDVELPPGRRAGVLERDTHASEGARLDRANVALQPAHGERPGRNGVLLQHATTLRPVDPLLVRACRREPVEHTPVWFMRQAGRSLPEYRELRKQYGLFDIVAQPELCAEVTLQPVRRHDVDAAVMFTDIMFPILGMGGDVQLVENIGPVIA